LALRASDTAASIGVAFSDAADRELAKRLKEADRDMYRDKGRRIPRRPGALTRDADVDLTRPPQAGPVAPM
jgi:hypothetical protein